MSWRRDGEVIAGGIAAGLGRGFLIACAGLTVAALFGVSPSVAAGLWNIAATAFVGSACLLGAALLRREQRDADDEAKRQVREVIKLVRGLPDRRHLDHDTSRDNVPSFTSRLDRERSENSTYHKTR